VRANRPEVDLQEGLFFGPKSARAENTICFRKGGEGRAPRFWASVVLDLLIDPQSQNDSSPKLIIAVTKALLAEDIMGRGHKHPKAPL
jgi:hypothetical protein